MKFNTNAFKPRKYQKTFISYICRDSTVRIITKEGRSIRDIPVFLKETLVIRNAWIDVCNSKYSNVIIESDSVIVIQAINGKSIRLKVIYNLVEDIIVLSKKVENIRILFYTRSANLLANKIAKESICACIPNSSK